MPLPGWLSSPVADVFCGLLSRKPSDHFLHGSSEQPVLS